MSGPIRPADTKDESLQETGRNQYAAIAELVEESRDGRNPDRIHEDALEVCVRSGWQPLGDSLTASEYYILVATGGPAARIIGRIEDGEVVSAALEVQDWGTPWTEYLDADEGVLMTYAQCFCFEGA